MKGLIIGAGEAGAFRSQGNHVASFNEHPDIELVGILEVNPTKAAAVVEKYKTAVFTSIFDALLAKPDIIVFAINANIRESYWEEVWKNKAVSTIICEKPLADSVSEAERIISKSAEFNKRLYVNYQRRTNTTYKAIKNEISAGTRGRIQNVTVHYTHGLKTNACHWINLALMIFGKPVWISSEVSPIPSPYPNDLNFSILLGYHQFHMQLIPLMSPQDSFFSGDMILTFEKERIIIPDPTMYNSQHAKRWRSNNGLLEETNLNFNINKSKNDFRPFLDQVIIEIKRNETSFMKSIDEIQTLKIIELAERSSLEHRRIDLD